MPRHKHPDPILPAWFARETDPCVQSVVEETFVAKRLAEEAGARTSPGCQELLQAASKPMKTLADPKADTKKRCSAGERAMRKFWEAKSCARRAS